MMLGIHGRRKTARLLDEGSYVEAWHREETVKPDEILIRIRRGAIRVGGPEHAAAMDNRDGWTLDPSHVYALVTA